VLAAVASLLPQRWVLLRYHLALVPFVALLAGVALARVPRRWHVATAIVTLAVPFCGSLAAIEYMRSPHPANEALYFIVKTVSPPEPIARLISELPPLNVADYPMGPNPYLDDLSHNPPRWVLTADLPDTDHPAPTLTLLRERYQQLADFQTSSRFSWATLGEGGAPHDWKYTHPRMIFYRRLDHR
jgi:hypothetical protein